MSVGWSPSSFQVPGSFSGIAAVASSAFAGATSAAWGVATKLNGIIKGTARFGVHGTLNGATRVIAAAVGQKIGERGVDALDEKVIQARMKAIPPTQDQICAEFATLARNMGQFIQMKTIDRFICGIERSEETYLQMMSSSASASASGYKEAYFKQLDASNLSIVMRWVAKLAYLLFSIFVKKNIQNTVTSEIKDLERFLRDNQFSEFNKSLSSQLKASQAQFEKWIGALKHVAQEEKNDSRSVIGVLEKELQKPEYYAGYTPEAFYRAVTEAFADKQLIGISLGKGIQAILLKLKMHHALLAPLNWIIQPIMWALGLTLRLILLIPDVLIENMLIKGIKKVLTDNQVLNKLLETIKTEIHANKRISAAMLKVANECLEEILFEVSQGKDASGKLDEKISKENIDALKRDTELSQEAIELYFQKNIRDLQARIRNGPPLSSRVDSCFIEETARGVGKINMLIHQKLTDSNFIKTKLHSLATALNASFSSSPKGDQESEQELIKQKQRFFELITTIFAKSITQYVSDKGSHFGLPTKGAFSTVVANKGFDQIYQSVSRSLNMRVTPEFLTFLFNDFLKKYLGDKKG